MRHTIAVVAMLFVMAAGLIMPAAAVEIVPTLLFSVRDGKTDSRYNVFFYDASGRQMATSGNTVLPLLGEEVVCQIVQRTAGWKINDFTFQYACKAVPGKDDWKTFKLDEEFGFIANMGVFKKSPTRTPLRFRLHIKDGISHESRVAGIKEPVTNFFMDILGLTHDNQVEYDLLFVAPQDREPETQATAITIDGSQFADSEATAENFRRTVEAFEAGQGELSQAIESLNLNDVKLAEGIQANGTAIANLEARVSALEACVEPLENIEVLMVPTSSLQRPVSVERCNFRINLPRGVVTRVETLDERGSRVYDRRYAGYIPMNNYSVGQTLAVRLTWEGRGSDQWKVVRSVRPNMVVNYSEMEVR